MIFLLHLLCSIKHFAFCTEYILDLVRGQCAEPYTAMDELPCNKSSIFVAAQS